MLTYEDCLGLCQLSEEEVEAIAEHEHIPVIVAAELGSYLIQTAQGEFRIGDMILEDIEAARRRGDVRHSAELKMVLKRFVETHPACRKQRPS